MTGKFLQIKKNKRESWEKDIYRLLFKSLEYSTFSKLVNEAFPKISRYLRKFLEVALDETDIKHWLNLIQDILRYETKDRSSLRIQEHILMAHSYI